jgi:glycosyltransferase involved in cell wall biosynthesis
MPLPPAPCGAVERIWHGLASEFVKKGHHVTFLCRSHPSQVSDETVNGIRYIRRLHLRRTGNIYVDLLKDFFYATRMAALLPRSDICVTNTFWLPVLASRFRKNVGKLVVAVHRYPKNQMSLYRNCDRLTAVSNAVRNAIVQQTPNIAHLVNVIHNPIKTEIFKPPQKSRIANGERIIIYTGRVHPEKGIHILIDAFAMLYPVFPNLRLRIVGPIEKQHGGGGKVYIAQLKEKVGDLPVVFSGAINDPIKLAEALQEATYYCYPSVASKGEALPVAPLEAMATGLVPVVSNIEQFNNYIDDGSNGYFFDHNSGCPHKALCDVLTKLITNTDRTKQMSVQAAKKAAEFNYQNIAKLYLDDWEGLLST